MKKTIETTRRGCGTRLGRISCVAALLIALLSSQDSAAAEISGGYQSANVTEVTDSVKSPDTTGVVDLYPEMVKGQDAQAQVTESTEGEIVDALKATNTDSPTKFSIETGVGYTVGGEKPVSCTRVVGSGKLFKGTKGETDVFGFVDVDDPMHTKGSGKLTLSKGVYKGLTLDGDYTFTGAGKNIARFGAGCTVKIGEGTFKGKAFLVNSDGSPISFKTSMGMNIGENGRLDAFMFVNVGPKTYYGEIEYVRRINGGLSLFAEVRLGGSIDGKITSSDSQGLVIGVVVPIK